MTRKIHSLSFHKQYVPPVPVLSKKRSHTEAVVRLYSGKN